MDVDRVDATNALAVFELLVMIKQVHHLEIMLYYLNEGNFLVQHNGIEILFKLGGDQPTGLDELLSFNLIICNCMTVRFNVKAQDERVVDVCRWMTSEEMNEGVLYTSDVHGLWPAKHTVEGLSEECGVNAYYFEELFDLTIVKMMSLHAFIQWDSGELNFPMATTIDDCCWGDLFIFYGLLSFVFDRGKILMEVNFNLEDKVVSKEVGINRNMDQDMGLDNGPKPKIWRVYERKKGFKEKKGYNERNNDVAK